MRLLPSDRVTLASELAADDAAGRLARAIGEERVPWFSFRRPREPFLGKVDGRSFELMQELGKPGGLRGRNSFQPVILGEIAPAGAGSLVRVRMRLHRLVAAFMAVWFGGVAAWAVAVVATILNEDGTPRGPRYATSALAVAFALAFATGAWALMTRLFRSEAREVRRILCELLAAREVPERGR